MRVVGRVRISRLTEQSTSVERQRELIEKWADMQGHTIVGWATDLDLSGTVDPFESPALGPWFAEDKLSEWDILCAWKLDRLGRRVIPLNRVFGWMLEHDKTLVCISDNIDLSTWVGRLVANVIAGVAEGELEAISERTKASRKKLLESGRWAGGTVPFGFRPVELPTGGWRLELHPEESAVLLEVVSDVIAGEPVSVVGEKYQMPPSSLWQILESKQLMGHATHGGATVRDSQGQPVFNSEPLLSPERWGRLQDALEARRQGPKRTKKTSPLLGVVKCFDCGLNLLHKTFHRDYGKRVYRYYHCRVNGHCAQVDAEIVEEQLENGFLEAVGDKVVRERVFRQAENHEIELDEAKRAVDELSLMVGTMTSDTVRKRLTEQMRALDFQIAALEKLPVKEAGYEYIETDKTYSEAWNEADTEGRRQLLLRSGITYKISRLPGTQIIKSNLYVPDEILDRLNTKNPPTR